MVDGLGFVRGSGESWAHEAHALALGTSSAQTWLSQAWRSNAFSAPRNVTLFSYAVRKITDFLALQITELDCSATFYANIERALYSLTVLTAEVF